MTNIIFKQKKFIGTKMKKRTKERKDKNLYFIEIKKLFKSVIFYVKNKWPTTFHSSFLL